MMVFLFFFKQKTAYEIYQCDWSSDVCSSDLNAGSLEKELLQRYGEPCPEALVESALNSARMLEDEDFHEFKISVKASDVFLAVAAYQGLAEVSDYPLHIGITEAGGARTGTVKSSIGLGNLLCSGIGDTLRVSLSADPVEEVRVGFELLKGLGLRHRGVNIIACPSCARQQFDVINTVRVLEERLAHITAPLTISVIGCVVNGPGEALMTDIGLTGGGRGTHQIYVAGLPDHRLKDVAIVDHLVAMVESIRRPDAFMAAAPAADRTGYRWVRFADGSYRGLTADEAAGRMLLPEGGRLYKPDNIASQRPPGRLSCRSRWEDLPAIAKLLEDQSRRHGSPRGRGAPSCGTELNSVRAICRRLPIRGLHEPLD